MAREKNEKTFFHSVQPVQQTDPEQLHRIAEEKAAALPLPDINALSHNQIQKMVHEMKVRQIELELQIEALQQAKSKWEVELTRYLELIESQFQHSPDIILIIDRDYKIEVINRIVAGDHTVESLKGVDAIGILPAEHRQLTKQAIDKCFETGQIQEFEHSIGAGKWVRARIVPIGDDDVIPRLMILSTDITERKIAEAALRQSEERLRSVIDHTPAAYFYIDREGVFRRVNRAWLEMHGYESEAEVLGRHFSFTQVEADLEGAQRTVERLLAGDPIPSGEFSRRRRDGSIGYHTFSAHPVIQGDEVVGLEGFLIDITERRLAEDTLRKSETKIREILQYLDEGYFSATLDGILLDHNQAFSQVLGFSVNDDLKGQKAPNFWQNPDDRKLYIDELTAQGHVKNYPAKIKTIQGESIFVLLNAHIVKDEAGMPTRIDGTVSDITERRKVEESLEKSEEKLAKAFRASPVSISIVDMKDGRYIDANDLFLKQTGYQREEVIGHTATELGLWLDPNDRQRFRAELSNKGSLQDYEVQFRMRSGQIRDCLLSSEIIELEGEPCIFTFVADITERKQAEHALNEKDAMLANIASQVPGMLYQFMMRPDGSFCVPYSSHGVEDIFGCTPEQVRDDFTPIFNAIHPEDREKILQTIETSVKSLSQWMCEYRVQLPGQPVKWIFGNSIPEKKDDGAIVWSGYNMDISERMKAEEEKTKLQTHLQQSQKIESVGRLAGGVAHDFNNMLGVILGYTEMALTKLNPADSLYTDLTEIMTAAQRSAKITRQLLAFARKQTVAPIVLDLNGIVAGMLKMLERLIGEDIALSWQPAEDLWPVKMDASQIDQILANLCINARDAISGVGKIAIETGNSDFNTEYCAVHTGFKPGAYVRLTVCDNGCGMDQATLTHIFEPFFTTKAVGEGTGLGLAMIYGAVHQNDGFIDIQSEPGKGTTFSIYLPKYEGKDIPSTAKNAPKTVKGGRETVLLVEDEPAVLSMTKIILERLGYTVLPAGTIKDAIQLAREHAEPIHLLMTDVVLPEMNGRDLYQEISALRPGLKCLFMSGYTASALGRRDQLDEGIHFLQKPFSRQDLAVKLRVVLSES